jgi:hypothetical protein
MATKVNDTVQGFNTYIAELKKEPQVDYLFSLTLFDTETVKRHVDVKLADVHALDDTKYGARRGG